MAGANGSMIFGFLLVIVLISSQVLADDPLHKSAKKPNDEEKTDGIAANDMAIIIRPDDGAQYDGNTGYGPIGYGRGVTPGTYGRSVGYGPGYYPRGGAYGYAPGSYYPRGSYGQGYYYGPSAGYGYQYGRGPRGGYGSGMYGRSVPGVRVTPRYAPVVPRT